MTILQKLGKVGAQWRRRVRFGPTVIATALIAGIGGITIYRMVVAPSSAEYSQSPTKLGIEDLARKVKAELEQLETDRVSKNEDTLFRLKDFDMEISFIVKASSKNKTELSPEVVVVGSEQEHSREATHKVILHLEMAPSRPATIPFRVSPINPDSPVVTLPAGKIK